MKLRWTSPALRDLEAIGVYIARADPNAAQRVVDAIFAHVGRLAEFPQIGRPGRVADTREFVVPTTLFIVAHRVRVEHVEILAVLHGARRWPDRFDR